MRATSLPWLVLVLVSLSPSLRARADVVWSAPCPWGARETTSHAGPRCAPWPCTSDAQCAEGRVCRPWRVCTQSFSVPPAGLGAFRDPPPSPHVEEQVVAACEPAQHCDGDETPRPPTTGTATGAVRCVEATYCVQPSFPRLPSDVPGTPPSEPAPGRAAPSDPAPAPSTTASAQQPASTCACRGPSGQPSRAGLAALGLGLAIVARRSRRAR